VIIRAVMLGVGEWARKAHLPALTAHPQVQVVACVDADSDRARSAAADFAVPAWYDSLDALLADRVEADLLVIAAPDDVHPAAIRGALSAGMAVFCEKPLANDAPTAIALSEEARAVGAVASVGYSFRYSPAVQALRADLASGVLGEPWLIEVAEHNAQFHPLMGKPLNWKADPEHARAGALFEYGSHVLDLCLWLLGPATSVSAHLVKVLPQSRLDDIATLQLQFAGGAVGTLVSSWLLTGGFPGITIRLHGSRGLCQVELNDTIPGGERYSHYELDGSVREVVTTAPLLHGPSSYARLHLDDLVRVVSKRTDPGDVLPTIAQAAHTQQVLEAALSATRSWVQIPAPLTVFPSVP
jgi:predicted dehydrogenase